jgi:hypothetical protein
MILGWVLTVIFGYERDENYIMRSTVIVLFTRHGIFKKGLTALYLT